jgi:hypothetical protein
MAETTFDPLASMKKPTQRKVTLSHGSSVDPAVVNALVRHFWRMEDSAETILYPQPAIITRTSPAVRLPAYAMPVLHGVPCGILMTTIESVKTVIVFDIFKPEFNTVIFPPHSTWHSASDFFMGTLLLGVRVFMDIRVYDAVSMCGRCFAQQADMPFSERLKTVIRAVSHFPSSMDPFTVSVLSHVLISTKDEAASAIKTLQDSVVHKMTDVRMMRGVQLYQTKSKLTHGPSPHVMKWDPLVFVTLQFEVDKWMCCNRGEMQCALMTEQLCGWTIRTNDAFVPEHHCRAVFQVITESKTLRMLQEVRPMTPAPRRKAVPSVIVPYTTLSVNEFATCEVSTVEEIEFAVRRATFNITSVDDLVVRKF